MNTAQFIGPVLLAVLALPLIPGCDGTNEGSKNEHQATPSALSTSESILALSPNVGEAIQSLKKLAEQADDSALATGIPYLSRKPEKGSPARGDDYDFAAGLWKMRLDNRTWTVAVFQQDGSMWFYSGKFQKDNNGYWEAVLTSKEGAPNRGRS